MFRLSLTWKIFASTVALVVLTAVLVGWLASREAQGEVRRDTERTLHAQAHILADLVAPHLGDPPGGALQVRVIALGERTDTRLTVIAADGTVLADSEHDPTSMENHGDRPEVLKSRQQGTGGASRRSATLDMEMIYVAHRIDTGARLSGYARVALPLTGLDERLAHLRGAVAGAAGIAILVGLCLALLVARRVSRPLRSMIDAATAVAGGDYERRVRVDGGDEVGRLGTAFNRMAERLRHREAALFRDRQELRAIVTGMGEGLLAVDGEDRIVLMNDAAAAMLDVDKTQVTGAKAWEAIRVPSVTDALAAAVEGDPPPRREATLPVEDGERTLRLHAAPLRDPEGGRAGAVLVLADISELRRLEGIRRDFVANASHELKTPVAAIRGLVETILADRDMPPDVQQGFLDRVVGQTDRLAALVEEMLALSRLEAADAPAVEDVVDLREPLRDALESLEGLATDRGIRLMSEVPEGALPIRGSQEALRRVAANLIENALKYSPRDAAVHVRLEARKDEAVLEVQDAGPGIPAQLQERIFERFFRVDEGRSRDVGGSGLGLAIVKHLTHAMGGRILVSSAPGEGSTFHVHLPLAG